MDAALLVLLILLNGLLAMSEMALTASRRTRLQVMLDAGERGAQTAIGLHEEPTRFLSTVQIGITSIGILNGIVGEAAFAVPFAAWLVRNVPFFTEKSAIVAATAVVVITITFLTIIFGELVPKRFAQLYPETVARLVAMPMSWLSTTTRPFVAALTATTEAVLRLLGVPSDSTRTVTEEEITASLAEGLDAGVIEQQEHLMVRNVLRLHERQVGSMMVPRSEITWLDVTTPLDETLALMFAHPHTRYPVCRGDLSDIVGIVSAHTLLPALAKGLRPSITDHASPPVFVPETLTGMELLERFRTSDTALVFVVDEYGEVQGLITVHDVLEVITGEFGGAAGDGWAVQREDGSWLFDGMIPTPELKDRLGIEVLPEEDKNRYNTLAGMIILLLGRLPNAADHLEWEGWRFEVVDMDGKRVDKVLATPIPAHARDS